MKKIIFMMIGAATLALSSCSDDDNGISDDEFAGVYRISSWDAPVAQDLNNDGTSSTDLTGEYNCYTAWEIDLNADHTFTHTYNTVSVADGQLTCTNATSTGTWSRNGQTLTLTNTLGGSEATSMFTVSGNNEILTQTSQGEYPTIFEQIWVMESGTVTVVYTKTDDQ